MRIDFISAAISPAATPPTSAPRQPAAESGATPPDALHRKTSPDPASVSARKEGEEPAQKADRVISELGVALNFSRDEESGEIVVKMIDQNTGETLRQIPSEATLRLAATLGKLQGQMFDRQA
jgi:flagellar protein FlaG